MRGLGIDHRISDVNGLFGPELKVGDDFIQRFRVGFGTGYIQGADYQVETFAQAMVRVRTCPMVVVRLVEMAVLTAGLRKVRNSLTPGSSTMSRMKGSGSSSCR